MTVKDSLSTDLKEAMRQGDVLRRSVIRMLSAEIHNQEIEDKKELDDEAVIRVLTKQATFFFALFLFRSYCCFIFLS